MEKTKKIRQLIKQLFVKVGIIFGPGFVIICLLQLLILNYDANLIARFYPLQSALTQLQNTLNDNVTLLTIWLNSPNEKSEAALEKQYQVVIPQLTQTIQQLYPEKLKTKQFKTMFDNIQSFRWQLWRIVDIAKIGGNQSQRNIFSKDLKKRYHALKENFHNIVYLHHKTDQKKIFEINDTVSKLHYTLLLYFEGNNSSDAFRVRQLLGILKQDLIVASQDQTFPQDILAQLKRYFASADRYYFIVRGQHEKGVYYEINRYFLPLRITINNRLNMLTSEIGQQVQMYRLKIKFFLIISLSISLLLFALFITFGYLVVNAIVKNVVLPAERLAKNISMAALGKKVDLSHGKHFIDEFKELFAVFERMLTQRQKQEYKLIENANKFEEMVNHDSLTGLPNYYYFKKLCHEKMENVLRFGQNVLIIYLRMHNYDEACSYLTESKMRLTMKLFAKYLIEYQQNNSIFAKTSDASYFIALVLEKDGSVDQLLSDFNSHLIACLNRTEFRGIIRYDMGSILYPEYDYSLEKLLSLCRFTAVEAHKNQDKNFMMLNNVIEAKYDRISRLEHDLVSAIAENQLSVVYQAQYQLDNAALIGCEALIRWNHPELGEVPPEEFIPIAERMDLIKNIGQFLIETAFSDYRKWRRDCQKEIKLAINASLFEFLNLNYIEYLLGHAETYQIQPEFIEIEVTESVIGLYADKVITVLNELHRLGFNLAIDDFGTGYSSLARLKSYNFDLLKVDKKFIDAITYDKRALELLKSIVSMGRVLNSKILVEGVETSEQVEILQRLGCDYAQGYYFSKPLHYTNFIKLL